MDRLERRASFRHLPTFLGRQNLTRALRWAPWVVFGPITGFLMERAVASFGRRQWVLGIAYIGLNIAILLAIPLATAKIAGGL
jgi:hypothetical protein